MTKKKLESPHLAIATLMRKTARELELAETDGSKMASVNGIFTLFELIEGTMVSKREIPALANACDEAIAACAKSGFITSYCPILKRTVKILRERRSDKVPTAATPVEAGA